MSVSVEIDLAEDGHLRVARGESGDVAADPLGYLRAVRAGITSLEEALEPAVHAARRQRMTWEEISNALGVTRQSAWERYALE